MEEIKMDKEKIVSWFEGWIKTFDREEVDDSEEILMDFACGINFMKEAAAFLKKESTNKVGFLKENLDSLTDEVRFLLINQYCQGCGSKDIECQCWREHVKIY